MIQQIQLTNFQSHNASTLDFHSGVNAIVGPSDKGKSAILRGIYWALTNRPAGVSVVSDWARDAKGTLTESASVKLTTPSGEVTRFRDKDTNGYLIGGTSLEAIGQAVPEQVEKLLNIGDVNIQRQLDAPFMLGSSAGEVARFLNQSVKLDAIDSCLSAVESNKRASMKTQRALESEFASLSEDVAKLSWVTRAEEVVVEYSALLAEFNLDSETAEALKLQVDEYINSLETVEALENIEPAEKLIESLKNLSLNLEMANSEVCELETDIGVVEVAEAIENTATYAISKIEPKYSEALELMHDIKEVRKAIAVGASEIIAFEGAAKLLNSEVDSAIAVLETLKERRAAFNTYKAEIDLIDTQIDMALGIASSLKQFDKDILELESQLETAKSELDICPTCKRKLEVV